MENCKAECEIKNEQKKIAELSSLNGNWESNNNFEESNDESTTFISQVDANSNLWKLSQSELIAELIQSQSKISHLEKICKELGHDKLSNFSEPKIEEVVVDNKFDLKESCPDIGQLEEVDSFPLIQSPYVTTPPYEFIILSKDNEKKYRIYMNPKIDKIFKDELNRLKSKESFAEDQTERKKESTKSFSSSRKSSILPLPHLSSDATIIQCFDPSEVDMELKKTFKANPPITHKIVRRKSRVVRGSSVPAIDSYYGTQDLEKVGHASYFIPDLSPSERKAIGWKDKYTYGKWKYSTPKISTTTSGHVPLGPIKSFYNFSRVSLRDLLRKSKSSYKSKTSSVITQASSETSSVSTLTSKLKLVSSKEENKNQNSTLTDADISDNIFDEEDIFLVVESPNQSSSCFLTHGEKCNLKKLMKWLVPCYKLKPNAVLNKNSDNLILHTCSKVDVNNDDDNNLDETTNITRRSPDVQKALDDFAKSMHAKNLENNNSHRHHHNKRNQQHQPIGFGCFHFGHGHKTQVVGGDVTDEDSVSFQNIESMPTENIENKISSTSAPSTNNEMQGYDSKLFLPSASTFNEVVVTNPTVHVSSNFEPCSIGENGNQNYKDDECDEDEDADEEFDEFEDEYENCYYDEYKRSHGAMDDSDDAFELIPETRFLDPKDLDLDKYQYKIINSSETTIPPPFYQDHYDEDGEEDFYDDEYEEDYEDDEHESENNFYYQDNFYSKEDDTLSVNISNINSKIVDHMLKTVDDVQHKKAIVSLKEETCKVV